MRHILGDIYIYFFFYIGDVCFSLNIILFGLFNPPMGLHLQIIRNNVNEISFLGDVWGLQGWGGELVH